MFKTNTAYFTNRYSINASTTLMVQFAQINTTKLMQRTKTYTSHKQNKDNNEQRLNVYFGSLSLNYQSIHPINISTHELYKLISDNNHIEAYCMHRLILINITTDLS